MFSPIPLQPGDHLLYGKSDLFGLITSVKTWSPAVHIEVYCAPGYSVASRNGIGVNLYPVRLAQLIAVLRPRRFDLEAAMQWFRAHARGEAYDWLGLLCFTLAVKQGSKRKMFCSEFAARLDRHAGCRSFHPEFDADRIAPGNFAMSPAFEWAWKREGVEF
jgi:hypothetical protein